MPCNWQLSALSVSGNSKNNNQNAWQQATAVAVATTTIIENKTTNNRGIGHHSLHLLGMALNFRFPVLGAPTRCVAIGGHVCLYLSRFLSNILRHSTARGMSCQAAQR